MLSDRSYNYSQTMKLVDQLVNINFLLLRARHIVSIIYILDPSEYRHIIQIGNNFISGSLST